MDKAAPQITNLSDYQPYPFSIDQLDLMFDLGEADTIVTAKMKVSRLDHGQSMFLDGEDLELLSVRMDGLPVDETDYVLTATGLTLEGIDKGALLEIVTRVNPQDNTQLSGLYKSSGNFCTQCEAEGFRRITFYPDRPDVLSKFTVRIVAEKADYPVLLSNGNLTEEGAGQGTTHYVVWEDPFPKPAYLFALVAGNLAKLEDQFTTCSGREVALRIYSVQADSDKCRHAMDSLKKAMRWDEDVFGLEYDLDIYNIVAVSDFNMGAMENKSLNIFNTSCVLATPATATDTNFGAVESVVAHEYFHNWTGNRITCRDWFQLSLKEGLTVFRDQLFSADMGSSAVQRIEDVRMLRSRQFPEDAGPQAHPIRPDSYMEINNFYTATVYEKGAEVIRMIHTILGPEKFRAGMDQYVRDQDGRAATCDDFVAAMMAASGVDLDHFKTWYHQAGTPQIKFSADYDPARQTYTMTVEQSTDPTPGQPVKLPLHIPFTVGLLGADGRDMPLMMDGENAAPTTRVLDLTEHKQSFTFSGITEKPVPSLLRGFSAPVILNANYSREDLAFLMAHDSDAFSRWEAGQSLATEIMLELVEKHNSGNEMLLDARFVKAIRLTLEESNSGLAKSFAALAVTLPTPSFLAQQMNVIDVDGIYQAHRFVRTELASQLGNLLWLIYNDNMSGEPFEFSAQAVGQRQLKNTALSYLVSSGSDTALRACLKQLHAADNMTDELAALSMLTHLEVPERADAFEHFYEKWRNDALVLDKWFAVQATSERSDTTDQVMNLQKHPAYSIRNPNKVRALVGAFTSGNPVRFHTIDGAGYRILTDTVLSLDTLNPQVAARLMGGFNQWRRYDIGRQSLMSDEINRVLAKPGLSRDVYEIASKALGN